MDKIEEIEVLNGKKNHCKLLASDGKEYILKKVCIPNQRLAEFTKITKIEVPSFQRILQVEKTTNKDEYSVVAEWIEGCTFNSILYNITDIQKQHYVKVIANKLKNIHVTYEQQYNVSFTEKDVERILDQEFLKPEIKELLLSYMISKLPLINSRFPTIVHGDMHIGNILITKADDIVFIDLDDVRFGDAFIDLVYAANIILSKEEYSTYYLFLKYYFDDKLPQEFWPVVNFYSICKAIMIMKEEVLNSVNGQPILSIDSFIQQHDGLKKEKPYWYKELYNVDHR